MDTVTQENVVLSQNEPILPEKPKKFNFLIILLSVLLFISTSIAVFFAYQTQTLAKELTTLKNNTEPTPVAISLPTQILMATDSGVVTGTANWKTYTNTKYGFSFKYPADLKVDQMSSSPYEQFKLVYMGEKQKVSGRTQTSIFDGYIFYISLRGSDPIDKVAQETFNRSKQNCSDQTTWSAITDSTIDGKNSKTYEVLNCMTDYTENFVSSGGNTFAITQIYVGEDPEYRKYKEVTNQILSTFKFTN